MFSKLLKFLRKVRKFVHGLKHFFEISCCQPCKQLVVTTVQILFKAIGGPNFVFLKNNNGFYMNAYKLLFTELKNNQLSF